MMPSWLEKCKDDVLFTPEEQVNLKAWRSQLDEVIQRKLTLERLIADTTDVAYARYKKAITAKETPEQ